MIRLLFIVFVNYALHAQICLIAIGQENEIWVKPPTKQMLDRIPGLVHHTIDSKAMKTRVGYCVVLPPGYADGHERYPVVYWLHGGGGNESSSLFTAQSWNNLYNTSRIRKVILVYPNGFRSGYMDHVDGKTMVESMIIDELIPHIDEKYRTIAMRAGRAAHGFSMGASGSLKFAIKYPELFCSAVAYGGGAIDLGNTTNQWILDILENNLGNDRGLIRENNTYFFLTQNLEVIQQNGTPFLLICGEEDSWKESAFIFQKALEGRNIPCELTLVAGVGHDIVSLTKAEGEAAALFQDRVFTKTLKKSGN